jgi:hypothetical protein
MAPAVSKRRWLKWMLISFSALLSLVIAAIALFAFSLGRPSRVEAISDRWVVEHYSPWNPDGHYAKYLARRGAFKNNTISGKIFDVRYVGDDCVIYSDYDYGYGLYGVCGERNPVYVVGFGDHSASDLQSDPVTIGQRKFPVSEIKRAAQLASEEVPGGNWSAQREAFPDSSVPPDAPHFVLFHNEQTRRRLPIPKLAYRYLGHDCLLYVDPPGVRRLLDPAILGAGQYPVAAVCGKRYDAYLGTVEQPSDITAGEAIPVNGHNLRVKEITRRAMSERDR